MGEAKRKSAAERDWSRWRDVDRERPPRDAQGLVALVRITCPCAYGGIVPLPAGRIDDEWIIGDFDHSYDIIYWCRLPDYPADVFNKKVGNH